MRAGVVHGITMVQAHNIRSTLHDVVQDPQEISHAGGASFVWSHAKIRIAALILFGAATPALVGDRLLIRTEHRLYSIRRKA